MTWHIIYCVILSQSIAASTVNDSYTVLSILVHKAADLRCNIVHIAVCNDYW